MALTVTPAELVAAAEASGSPGLLGRHPSWERVPLKAVAEVLNGFPFKSDQFNIEGKGTPLVRIRDVGRQIPQTWYVGEFDPAYLINSGDILVGMDGDFRVAAWRGPQALLNQRVCKISVRNHKFYDERFLVLCLQGYLDAIAAATSSVTVKHLSSRSVENIPLPLPPLAEQHRIVEALEEQLSRLEEAKAQFMLVDARIEALIARCMDDLVLGEGWRTRGTLSADLLTRLGSSKTKRFRYEALPQLPSGWQWCRAEEVCVSIFCGSTPKPHLMHSGRGAVPFLKVYNIMKAGGIDFSVNPTFVDVETHEGLLKRSRVRPGDVVTNIVGPPLGKTALIPSSHPEWNINQAIVAFRGGDSVTPDWLALVLRSPMILSLLQATAKATAGQFNVALSTCRDLPIPVPPVSVQQEITARGQTLLDGIERLRPVSSTVRRRADALHRALLGKAFRGALVPQDPNDESPSVSLTRIAGEQEVQSKAKRPGKTTARKLTKAPAPRAAEASSPAPEPTPAPALAVQQEFDL
ncbi:restriction endonuclease subunit S [Streptomyces sp. NPDC001544]|uniref:restriction endonuclease subunit S n=1 Tax=Streptomyces sp. NPDC001544 TaxID=3364584 RepID=UPI0036B40218